MKREKECQPRLGEETEEAKMVERTHEQVSSLLVTASDESRDDGVVRALVRLRKEVSAPLSRWPGPASSRRCS